MNPISGCERNVGVLKERLVEGVIGAGAHELHELEPRRLLRSRHRGPRHQQRDRPPVHVARDFARLPWVKLPVHDLQARVPLLRRRGPLPRDRERYQEDKFVACQVLIRW